MNTFDSLCLPKAVKKTLREIKFYSPTPIQSEAIPHVLMGKDLLASAQTGTGKTAAFGIPLVSKLLSDKQVTALIVTPTRELAAQVLKETKLLSGKTNTITFSLLIGGDSVRKQIHQLKSKPRVIVGTPGRIYDHLQRKSLLLNKAKFFVLDETDRMLEMGFSEQIDRIVDYLPADRQTLLFSATIPKKILHISKKYLTNEVRINIFKKSGFTPRIKQEVVHSTKKNKFDNFLSHLNKRSGSMIVFMRTKQSTEKMAKKLNENGHKASAINGDLRQNKRERVLKNFRKQKYRILVATDIASRGLDIPHVKHVINYDLPEAPEDYIHRIGRTGRAGSEGFALCFVTPSDKRKWKAIEGIIKETRKNKKIQRG